MFEQCGTVCSGNWFDWLASVANQSNQLLSWFTCKECQKQCSPLTASTLPVFDVDIFGLRLTWTVLEKLTPKSASKPQTLIFTHTHSCRAL